MESHKTGRSRSALIAVFSAAGVACLLVVCLVACLQTAPLNSYLRKDLPLLAIDLQFKDRSGDRIPTEQTRLSSPAAKAPKEEAEKESEVTGGDTTDTPRRGELKELRKKGIKSAAWVVRRRPVAFSLHVRDGEKVSQWLEKESSEGGLLASPFFRGLFNDLVLASKVRAEDLELKGLEGTFLRRFAFEALKADAVLHYDISRGQRGFVFSFVRGKCPYSAKALPVMCGMLARSGYTTARLPEPVLEMRTGFHRIFLTQYGERIYVSNGLETLLNVLENNISLPVNPPDAPLVLTVRAEAFLNRLLPVITSGDSWEVTAGFGLPPGKGLETIQFDSGKFGRHLRPKVFSGVFAGVPHDVFAAAAASFYLPAEISADEWRKLVNQGPGESAPAVPDEAGIAVLWDLDHSRDGLTEMGVIIANQSSPDKAATFAQYFSDKELAGECGGGTVFLAATSNKLLTRMKESCAGQSLSMRDWERGAKKGEYENAQMIAFMNPGVALREFSLAGGGGDEEETSRGSGNGVNNRKPDLEHYKKARNAMQREAERLFSDLPIFTFAGKADAGANVVRMKGITVKQGGAR
ncbi:MAG: hypothetical protein AB9866_30815 [Syntrophobacteraceae bacterium]